MRGHLGDVAMERRELRWRSREEERRSTRGHGDAGVRRLMVRAGVRRLYVE